ncbi:agrin-like [Tachypleus tridentatus]|uniref:agrin-like n=1 Tax=Tachypleus tridentatus TaxID=6853 RepID=UPI003FD6812C
MGQVFEDEDWYFGSVVMEDLTRPIDFIDLGSGSCGSKGCQFGGVCDYDSQGLPTCVCDFHCSSEKEPVCGSNRRLYDNECYLREAACNLQQEIRTVARDSCEGKKVNRGSCKGKKVTRNYREGKKVNRGSCKGKKVTRGYPEGKKVDRGSCKGRKVTRGYREGKKVNRGSCKGKKVTRGYCEGKKVSRGPCKGKKVTTDYCEGKKVNRGSCKDKKVTRDYREGKKVNRGSCKGKKVTRGYCEGKKVNRGSCKGKKVTTDYCEGKKATRGYCEGKKANRGSCEGKKATKDYCEGKKVNRGSCKGKKATTDYCEGKKVNRGSCKGKKSNKGYCEGKKADRGSCKGKKVNRGSCKGKKVTRGYCEGKKVDRGSCKGKKATTDYREGKKVNRGSCKGKKVTRGYPEGKKVDRGSCKGKKVTRGYCEGKKVNRGSCKGKKVTTDYCEGKKVNRGSCKGKKVTTDYCEGKKVNRGSCKGKKVTRGYCEGKKVDRGSCKVDRCPPNSYCHETPSFAKCCRKVALIKTCADSPYGCCPDGKTQAQGYDKAGCPSVCSCNRLGAYSQTCDPISNQCSCKPGVGGLRCDRCEPGFWGIHKIAEGNSGCISCGCSEYGSVRDDCEQTTGRCVCKPNIKGMKCDNCTSGKVLDHRGCVDESLSRRTSESCDGVTCQYGATCREELGKVQCICDFKCSLLESGEPVCGSDGHTYGSECQLRLFNCRYQKSLTVNSKGPCIHDATPTGSPVRRSTVQKSTIGQYDSKSTRDINPGVIENLYRSTRPTIAAPVDFDHPYQLQWICVRKQDNLFSSDRATITAPKPREVPAFSGRSWMELRRLEAYVRMSVMLEFLTLANDGILFYNGQSSGGGHGDFVSLAVRNGFVEFRYDLGSGPVELRSTQRLQPGKFHRVVAKRYLREGILTVEGQEAVTGSSEGRLKSLDLDENLYIGYIPTTSKGVYRNVGVSMGLVGCIRRLHIGRRKVDIHYPGSKDVISAAQIRNCSDNHCNSMPCQNGGTCTAASEDSYRCSCPQGYSGEQCEVSLSPCTSNPCAQGATCAELPQGDFSCKCPQGRRGIRCEEIYRDVKKVIVPEFNGEAFLQLPTLPNVGLAFTIEVWFLTYKLDGMLLYNGQKSPPSGDFVSLNLVDGYVQLRFDLGSGVASVS